MPLFHVQVYMPASLTFPKGEFALKPTEHAMRAAQNDRYGQITIPKTLHTSQYRIIEVETGPNNNVMKIVYKGRYDSNRDLVIVAIPQTNNLMIVKTVWINMKNDRHSTLDKSKYSTRL